MKPLTICLVYFKSLALANLDAALFSVRRQDLEDVAELIVVDNDTDASVVDVEDLIDKYDFPMEARLVPYRHRDPTKTHSWSTNVAMSEVNTDWVLFTRADYVLDYDLVSRFMMIVEDHPENWDGFITSNVYHLNVDIGVCEKVNWRQHGTNSLRTLPGIENDHTAIDAGVWMMRRKTFDQVGGLDERLNAWGHAQTHFQHQLFEIGVEFVRIPTAMFFHPQHAGPRDINVSHEQLAGIGADLKKMWSRYHGPKPY